MGLPDRSDANKIVGRSTRNRFTRDNKKRHDRRLRDALRDHDAVVARMDEVGVSVDVKNSGHHWVFSIDSKAFAEWWPSSAKLVFDKKYYHGIHTHGSDQLVELVLDRVNGKEGDDADSK